MVVRLVPRSPRGADQESRLTPSERLGVNKAVAPAPRIVDEELARLDAELLAHNLEGHWNLGAAVVEAEPTPWAEPYLWRWADVRRLLWSAGEMRGIEGGASRRTVRLCTPGNKIKWTTPTIHASVQLVKPGEVAEAHRHSMGAFRFVIEGEGGYTTVDGERMRMAPGDLILTPGWSWHDHGHDDGRPTIWIDVHDYPFTGGLNSLFFEPYKQRTQAVAVAASAAGLRPPHVFSSGDCLRSLNTSSVVDAALGRTFDYLNPALDGTTLPTMNCRLHGLASGQPLTAHRTTANRIYHVISGRGKTLAGQKTLTWQAGDIFVVPGWTWHRHLAEQDAVLFCVSDEPIFRHAGLLRREEKPNL